MTRESIINFDVNVWVYLHDKPTVFGKVVKIEIERVLINSQRSRKRTGLIFVRWEHGTTPVNYKDLRIAPDEIQYRLASENMKRNLLSRYPERFSQYNQLTPQ